MRVEEMKKLLATPWAKFNRALMKIEDEVLIGALLELEAREANRPHVKLRLHSRLNKLRALRERQEIMG